MWLAFVLMWLAARLPWPLQRGLGRGIGALALRLAGERRRAAAINLALCFPEKSAAQREALLRDSFRDFGIGLFEFARAWWGSAAPMRRTVRIEGREHLDALRAQGRLRYAAAMFSNEEIRPAMRHLKQGGLLWYAPDQDMRGKDTVFAPFFGVPAATITATHQFARLSGCAVVPFFHRREGADYVLRIAPPLADFPTSDAVADSAQVNAAIEAMVREAPSQYLWLHRRFKRRPPGMSSPY